MKISPEDRHEVAEMLRDEGFTDELMDKLLYVLNIDMMDAQDVDLACCLADLIDRPETAMRDLGEFTPHHRFRRMQCVHCGGVHWEQPNDRLRMSFCPYCGEPVTSLVEQA